MNGIDWTTCKRWRRQAVAVAELMAGPNGLNPAKAEAFKAAELVVGMDTGRPLGSDAFVVFHGRGFLQDIAHSGPMGAPAAARVFIVAYDQRGKWLEALCACCGVHRGGCDYSRSVGQK